MNMASTPKMPAYAVYQAQSWNDFLKRNIPCSAISKNNDPNNALSVHEIHQLSKKPTDSNSDANGTPEPPAKNRKTKGKPQTTPEIQEPSTKRKRKVKVEVIKTGKKKRGRWCTKKIPVVDQEEESDAESEEHSERSEEHSEEHREFVVENTNTGEIFPRPADTFMSKAYSCGTEAAEEAFIWLIHEVPPRHFFQNVFQENPYYLIRHLSNYYQGLFSSKDFDKILKENRLEYGVEIDVVAYIDEQRKPLVNGTIVYPDFVWNSYNEGYSVRMRNPQAYHQPLWQLCSLLQEYFSSCVGANMYLTPAHSQGFPPHWDDIDAFILQIEGKKHWKVYNPRNSEEEYPQISSGDLDQASLGKPCLDMEIKAGDLLYIPRGFIHQAHTTDEYSLHVTISTNQSNTWSDFLHHGIEAALEKATAENVELRRSIPKDYFDYAGCAMSKNETGLECAERNNFRKKAKMMVKQVLENFSVDVAADNHAAHFIHGCMRPYFNKKEGMCSIHSNGNKFHRGTIKKVSCLTPDSRVRWIRKRAFRLVMDAEGPKLFHTLGNGKNFKEVETCFLDVDDTAVPAISALFQAHPLYIKVKDLPVQGDLDAKREFAEALYYNGFLVTDQPLPPEDD